MKISYGKYILKIRLTEFLFSIKKKNTDYIIAKVLLKKIDEYPEIYIQEVAYLAHTTEGTVSKFCRKIGYEGFSQIKAQSQIEIDYSSVLPFIKNNHDTLEQKANDYLSHMQQIQRNTFAYFEQDQIFRISKKIAEVKHIYFFTGIHGFASVNYFSELASQIGKTVFPIHREVDEDIILDILDKDALVFAISLTGDWVFSLREKLKREKFEKFEEKVVLLCNTDKLLDSSFNEVVNFWNLDSFTISNSISDWTLHAFFTSLLIASI